MNLAALSSGTVALAAVCVYGLGADAWIVGPILLAVHCVLALGVFHPSPSWVCPTIIRGCTNGARCVALTFDDGPCPRVTPAVLRILADRGVAATFFVIGRAARAHPDVVRAIHAAGHEIGNHSYLHPRHIYAWPGRTIGRDALVATRVVERITGDRVRLYRPPVGFRSFVMAKVMRELGLRLVNFSARGYDTQTHRSDRIAGRILRRIRAGTIILLHDGSDTQEAPDGRAMLAALPIVIDTLLESGYRFVTVSAMLEGEQNAIGRCRMT